MRTHRLLNAIVLAVSMIGLTSACGEDNGGGDNGNGNGDGTSYQLTYNGNGHTHGSLPASVSLPFDAHTVIADPGDLRGQDMRDGIKRRFVTWNTSQDGSGQSHAPGTNFYMPDNDVILYAQWTTGDEVLRNVGPAGGLVFIDQGSADGGWRYMEAAPASTEWDEVQWGSYMTAVGGTEEGIGSGQANTDLIVAALNALGETGRAAQLCDGLSHNGFSDWFLPSRFDLQEMHAELMLVDGNPGGFMPRNYWSSSEVAGSQNALAFTYQFNLSSATPQNREQPHWVRAARTF